LKAGASINVQTTTRRRAIIELRLDYWPFQDSPMARGKKI